MKKSTLKERNKQSSRQRTSQRGFSLLEVLISMIIFLIVTGAIYGLLQVGRTDRNRASRRTDMLKNARAAIHLIGRDTLNAGLSYHQKGALVPNNFIARTLGLPPRAAADRDTLTSIIVGNNVFINNLQDDPNARTDLIAFAYRDVDYNCGDTLAVTGVSSVSGGATPRITFTPPISPPTCASPPPNQNPVQINDLYLVEGNTQIAVMATATAGNTLDVAPGDPLSINQAYNGNGTDRSLLRPCSTTTPKINCSTQISSFKRFFWVSYRVTQDGTLVRTSYGNNGSNANQQIQVQPLAYNVKDLQFRYVLTDGRVLDDPSVGADGIKGTADDNLTDCNLITQVTVMIKVASTEIDEQTGKPAVITLNATFSARNLQYDLG